MFVLGVTGGIGSGKSTAASLLERRGARILDADRIVRELYEGGSLPEAIERELGPGVLTPEGAVDRAALGKVVFASEGARRELEALVHPAVRSTVNERLDGWRAEGFTGIAVIDAALLVESDYEYPLDALLVVTAPESVRLDRLEGRGMDREEARRRMRAQADDEEKRSRADVVVDNGGTLEDLDAALSAALRELGRDEAPRSG